MQICLNPQKIENGLVLALGNFDGVHLGHKAVIEKARQAAASVGKKLAVITFEPHPVQFFKPELKNLRITTLRGKLKLLEKQGVDICYVIKFNASFANLSAHEFIEKYLKNNVVVTGYDFHFGKNRVGTPNLLKQELGESYIMLQPVENNGVIYSSSKVRQALEVADLAAAKSILGHNYFVEGRVAHGAGVGAKLGFPTANIVLRQCLKRPKYGVYKVTTNFGAGVANFGVRPTIDGKQELLEVHIFKFDKNIYGQNLVIEFENFIRPEKNFANIEELKKQIEADIAAVKLLK